MEGITPADIAAISRNNDENGWSNNPFVWLVWIWAFSAFGGNGFGGNSAMQAALTRSDLNDGFNMNNLNRGISGLGNGIADLGYSILNQTNGINTTVMQQANALGQGLANIGFTEQQCCCQTNRNIDSLRFENAKNTSDIVNAIAMDGEKTRALIVQNQMQDLRDQLADAKLANSQCAQNAYLVNQIRPNPIPAYMVASPYGSVCGM